VSKPTGQVSPTTIASELVDPAEDALRGAAEIAVFIGETERRTRYLIEKQMIPVGRRGSQFIASKRRLREDYERVTGGSAA